VSQLALGSVRIGHPARRLAPRTTVGLLAVVLSAWAQPAMALGADPDEAANLKQCEKGICQLILKRETTPAQFACKVSKTWEQAKIKSGVEKKKITWSLGDARCRIDVAVPAADVIKALTEPTYELKLATHVVRCEAEREKEVMKLDISLAPRIQFKDGWAKKAWIGLEKIEGPALIKGAVWTVAQAEDTFGLFHREMIEEINSFVHTKCAEWYPESARK
jgi:hypothetical protein